MLTPLHNSLLAALLFAATPVAPSPDVHAIMQQSLAATRMDWNAAPGYSFHELDRHNGGSKTYAVSMILGSPYRRLIAVNNRPLSAADQAEQQKLMDQAIAERRAESASDRARRTAEYDKERQRDDVMMSQIAQAFNFKFAGRAQLGAYQVYVLKATPKPDYRPPNLQAEVLRGMRGMLWIDAQSFQWVRVQATVVRPVSIAGFLARVEPGTRFELEKAPVGEDIWLPSHFGMRSRAKVLSIFPRRRQEDATFSDYQMDGVR